MRFIPTQSGGRLACGDTPYGCYRLDVSRPCHNARVMLEDGTVIGTATVTFDLPELQGHDVERERLAAKQGGCCGEPTDAK